MQFSKIKLQMVREQDFKYNSRIIKTPLEVVEYINSIEQLSNATEENTLLICLNSKNQVVAYSQIAKGGFDYCGIDIKTIYKTVLLANANKMILIHNHPSGSAKASQADINITRRIKETSKIMDIQLLDHIIVADDDFVSCMT